MLELFQQLHFYSPTMYIIQCFLKNQYSGIYIPHVFCKLYFEEIFNVIIIFLKKIQIFTKNYPKYIILLLQEIKY